MISVYNKMLNDTTTYENWEDIVSSKFCSLSIAMHYESMMKSTVAENAGFSRYESGDGKYENDFYTIREHT